MKLVSQRKFKKFHKTDHVTWCNACWNLFRSAVAHKFQLKVSTCNGGFLTPGPEFPSVTWTRRRSLSGRSTLYVDQLNSLPQFRSFIEHHTARNYKPRSAILLQKVIKICHRTSCSWNNLLFCWAFFPGCSFWIVFCVSGFYFSVNLTNCRQFLMRLSSSVLLLIMNFVITLSK